MRDIEKVTIYHYYETGAGLSESAVILVAMATGMGARPTKMQKKPNNSRAGQDTAKVCINH